MKSNKSIQASLRLLLLLEEFTDNEIIEAIELIESDLDSNNPLLKYLHKTTKRKSTTSKPSANKSKEPLCSRVVLDLEKTDKEKFIVLSKIDKLIREGKVLKNLADIKKIASQISKNFPSVKSRKEAIPKFMELLASMPINETTNIVETIMQSQRSNISESEYHELASFLIGNNKIE